MKILPLAAALLSLASASAWAQAPPDAPPTPPPAPINDPLVRRGAYDRPYLLRMGTGSIDVALGGYVDLVGSYLRNDGVSNGFTGEARRFNLFVTSRIANFIRLTSEIEFEHGAQEIALETAAVDLLFHHAFNLRAGILLSPIGRFNLTHDSPLYDVIDRPLVSTRIIPATLSEMGGGFFGALYPGGHKLTYEAYVVNGLGDGVIAAEGTRIAQGKRDDRFSADNNGVPSVVARVGYAAPPRPGRQIELGLSFYSGVYNTYQRDGLTVADPKWLHIVAWDGDFVLGPVTLRGELAYAHIDLPPGLTALHASDQLGLYFEVSGAVFQVARRPAWFRVRLPEFFDQAALFLVARVDYVDLNLNTRTAPAAGGGTAALAAGDETTRLTVGLSLRPVPATALRVCYQHEWRTDPLGNPHRGGGVQLGLASYF